MPDLNTILANLRRRRGDIRPETTRVQCPSHGLKPLASFTYYGTVERFCDDCLRTFLAPFKPELVEEPCHRCKLVKNKLHQCSWCDHHFCDACMRDESCIECADESEFPPEARVHGMKGS